MKKISRIFVFFSVFVGFILCFALSVSAAGVFADADADGVLTSADARIALRASVGLEYLDAARSQNCDFDYDGVVTASDAREILRISVGLGRSDDAGAEGMADAEFVGWTDKYYKIYRISGITFIDGILIANKTYSLPQSFAPGGLLTMCSDAFYTMQAQASAEGMNIYINSGYRSYSSQQSVYDSYVESYGYAYAEAQAARAGYSEHQSGLAIDLTNDTGVFTGSAQARWVAQNCADYGFILRYPEGKTDKTGYNYEAWHIRYVGTRVAQKITASGLCLEEYYGITSVYE